MSLYNTGERMIPEFHKGTVMYAEHQTRYIAAEDLVKGKIVLDIATGSGYGAKLLAKNAKKVFGVDVDADSIEYAKENFYGTNIEYLVGDGESIPLPDNSIDVVTTFETIEHIKDYQKFIKEVKRVLKPDGLAIVSTPNDLEFTEGNHYHLHEFEYDELVSLLKKDFKYIDSYFQATWVYVGIGQEDMMSKESVRDIRTYNLIPLDQKKYLYFYLLCSNRPIIEKVPEVGALGGHYSARELTEIQELNNKNLQDFKTVVKNANQENERILTEYQRLVDTKASLEARLDRIENSRLYKLARKAINAKHKITRH